MHTDLSLNQEQEQAKNNNNNVVQSPRQDRTGAFVIPVTSDLPNENVSKIRSPCHPQSIINKVVGASPVTKCAILTSCFALCLMITVGIVVGSVYASYSLECNTLPLLAAKNFTVTNAGLSVIGIDIFSERGDIIVQYGDFHDEVLIHVAYYGAKENDMKYFTEEFDYSDFTVRFKQLVQRPSGLRGSVGNCLLTNIKVYIPRLYKVSPSMKLTTEHGNVIYKAYSDSTFGGWNKFEVQVGTGNIYLNDKIMSSDVQLMSNYGYIEFATMTVTKLKLNTTFGAILGNITMDGRSSVDIGTISGNIKVATFVTGYTTPSISMQSDNGAIDSTVTWFSGDFDVKGKQVDIRNSGSTTVNYSINSIDRKIGKCDGYSPQGNLLVSTNNNVQINFN